MKTHSLSELLAGLPFFEGMDTHHLDFIAGCARNVRFDPGAFLLLEGKAADTFYVVRSGSVALETTGANRLETLHTAAPGEVVGWSWLVPPYTGHYDARAVGPVSAVAFDAVCVRAKCERDPAFGYEMFKRIGQLMVQRLMATRYQFMDVYR